MKSHWKVLCGAIVALCMVLGYAQGFKDGENLIIGTKGDLGVRRLGPAVAGITDGATAQGGIPALYSCGTTGTCTQAIPATKLLEVYGTIAMSSGNGTISALPFTGTTTFFCTGVANNVTTPVAVGIAPASASTATIKAGAAADVVIFHCIGT